MTLHRNWQTGQPGHVAEHNELASRIWTAVDAGAKTDGSTDASGALQALASENFTNGKSVYCPAGTYRIDASIVIGQYGDRIPVLRGDGIGNTVFTCAQNISMVNVQGSCKIEGIEFRGYESGAKGNGTGLYIQRAGRGTEVTHCKFNKLGYGIRVGKYGSLTPGSQASYVSYHHNVFNGCSEYGIYIPDVNGVNTIEFSHFLNGYSGAIGNAGAGIYLGYGSGHRIIGCDFSAHRTNIVLHGCQGPVVRDCSFEAVAGAETTCILTEPTSGDFLPPNYKVRNLLISGCSGCFNGSSMSFIRLRNAKTVELSSIWTTDVGARMIDASDSVEGLVLLNCRNDHPTVPLFVNGYQPPETTILA